MKAIYTRSYKAKKNIAHDKFHSSSWTSALRVAVVRVNVFCPELVDILSSTEDIKFWTL